MTKITNIMSKMHAADIIPKQPYIQIISLRSETERVYPSQMRIRSQKLSVAAATENKISRRISLCVVRLQSRPVGIFAMATSICRDVHQQSNIIINVHDIRLRWIIIIAWICGTQWTHQTPPKPNRIRPVCLWPPKPLRNSFDAENILRNKRNEHFRFVSEHMRMYGIRVELWSRCPPPRLSFVRAARLHSLSTYSTLPKFFGPDNNSNITTDNFSNGIQSSPKMR